MARYAEVGAYQSADSALAPIPSWDIPAELLAAHRAAALKSLAYTAAASTRPKYSTVPHVSANTISLGAVDMLLADDPPAADKGAPAKLEADGEPDSFAALVARM